MLLTTHMLLSFREQAANGALGCKKGPLSSRRGRSTATVAAVAAAAKGKVLLPVQVSARGLPLLGRCVFVCVCV